MDKQKNNEVLSLPKRKSSDITQPVIFKKAKLSPFHLYEILGTKTLHSVKYYEQIVSQPEPKQEVMSEKIVAKSTEAVKEQRGKKGKWINAIFMFVNIGIVVGILLYNFLGTKDPLSIGDLFSSKINWMWLGLCVVLFFAIFVADAAAVYMLVGYSTKRLRPFLSYKSHAMCRFYDSITPLSTGGQPFQIYYLAKRGVPAGTATSVPIAKYLYAQFFNVVFIAAILIFQNGFIAGLAENQHGGLLLTLCYIGFAILVLLFGSIMFLSYSKKVAPACTVGVLKLLHKMHIVKDYRKSFVKVMHTIREYIVTMRQFISNGWISLGMLVSRVFTFVLTYSVPFFVYAVFIPLDANWFSTYVQLFTIGVVADLACSFMPLPGGTGMAEFSFAMLFFNFFTASGAGSESLALWALLLWRILTYYGVLLQGLVIMLYDHLHGNKKVQPLLERFKREDENKRLLEQKKQPIKVVNKKDKERRKKNER